MRMFARIACLVCCAMIPATNAAAQLGPRLQPRLGVEFITGSVDDGAAEAQGTGTWARGFQAVMGVTAFRVLDVSLDLGILGVGDERSFNQETTQGEMESTVGAGIATVAAGVRTPALRVGGPFTVSGGVSVGHTFLSAERSITNCVDCHSEDVSIGAGSFWEPGIFVFRNQMGISARYRTYGDASDIRSALVIGLVMNTRPKSRAPQEPAAVPAAPADAGR